MERRVTELEAAMGGSFRDHLTGLHTMTCFFELAERGCGQMLEAGKTPAILFFDLSGMKSFNHKYGFVEGDNILKEFAKLLESVYEGDKCSRFVQDHFVVYTDEKDIKDSTQQLFAEWKKQSNKKTLPIRVGVYIINSKDFDIVTACDNAKAAADSNRNSYVSGINYFDKAMEEIQDRKDYIISNLDKAISEKWIKVYYQPIIRTVNGKVCDEEALSRWIDPEKGFLSPADFIGILEEAHLIYKLDLYVVDEIISKLKIIEKEGLPKVPQSVNLSRTDFEECDIVEEICRRMDKAGLDHSLLTIEITESIIASNMEYMKFQLERFRNLGFKVWMDDFGSGYSSLDVLQDLTFDLIKFDMRFLRQTDKSTNGKIILSELMRMAAALGFETVCEGVETEENVSFLGDIGCCKLQGYYFTKPLPLEKILERYREGTQIGFENTAETEYYDSISKINLNDLDWVVNHEDLSDSLYNGTPMVIMELNDTAVRIVRCNSAYTKFSQNTFERNIGKEFEEFVTIPEYHRNTFLANLIKCSKEGNLIQVSEKMPNNVTINTILRRVACNPVTGTKSVAVAVLSVKDETLSTTYANIADSLAADYFEIFYVNINTEDYVIYISDPNANEFTERRRSTKFFTEGKKLAQRLIYKSDRADFVTNFTKDNIMTAINEQGRFALTYRIVQKGKPVYVCIKAMPMSKDNEHIIVGISNVNEQMKQQEALEKIKREQLASSRLCALVNNYFCMYTVNLEDETYYEFGVKGKNAESMGFNKGGVNFFERCLKEAKRLIRPEDYPLFVEAFSKEKVLNTIKEEGIYLFKYRITYGGKEMQSVLKAAEVKESDGNKLIVGLYMDDINE